MITENYLIKISKHILLFAALFIIAPKLNAQTNTDRAAWMKDAKLGVMTHYLSDWKARENNETMTVELWNEMINNFDVDGLADQLKSIGAGYYVITIGQNSGYYLSPNKTYDDLVGNNPSKCSKRDLVADLYKALNKVGIKLIVYLPSGAPNGDKAARKALEWKNGPHRNSEFQIKWEKIISEWSTRWGKNVAGWWFDGCYWPNTMYRSEETPNFKSFAEAARAGNPQSAVAFNPGVVYRTISITPYEDYIAGEIDHPEKLTIKRVDDGVVDGNQLQILSYLGERWGLGSPRFSNEQVIEWSKQVTAEGGTITWDVPILKTGLISEPFVQQLKAIDKAIGKN